MTVSTTEITVIATLLKKYKLMCPCVQAASSSEDVETALLGLIYFFSSLVILNISPIAPMLPKVSIAPDGMNTLLA